MNEWWVAIRPIPGTINNRQNPSEFSENNGNVEWILMQVEENIVSNHHSPSDVLVDAGRFKVVEP